jgi:hypothetical protein
MIPQHSSQPERSMCIANPVCSQTRSECMYLHNKVPILCESRSRMHGSINSNHMTSSRSKVAFSRILYPPGDPVLIPGSSPPTTGWSDATAIPRCSSGSQSTYSYSRCRSKKPPDKGKCMYSLVDPPDPPQSYNLIQSNRKNRPFSYPSSWAVPKTWRSLERKQHKEIITCH